MTNSDSRRVLASQPLGTAKAALQAALAAERAVRPKSYLPGTARPHRWNQACTAVKQALTALQQAKAARRY